MTPEEHRQRDTVGAINLDHALQDTCTDPDCEIHNLDVAFAEEVIGLTDMAFFVAGFFAGISALADQHDSVKDNMRDEIMQILRPQKAG